MTSSIKASNTKMLQQGTPGHKARQATGLNRTDLSRISFLLLFPLLLLLRSPEKRRPELQSNMLRVGRATPACLQESRQPTHLYSHYYYLEEWLKSL